MEGRKRISENMLEKEEGKRKKKKWMKYNDGGKWKTWKEKKWNGKK